MDYSRFIKTVGEHARVDTPAEALNAARATLETLAERIGGDEARHLASQLPAEIGQYLVLTPAAKGERFSFDEFCARVAAREGGGGGVGAAEAHARGVVSALELAVSGDELSHVIAVLPEEFLGLFVAQFGERLPP